MLGIVCIFLLFFFFLVKLICIIIILFEKVLNSIIFIIVYKKLFGKVRAAGAHALPVPRGEGGRARRARRLVARFVRALTLLPASPCAPAPAPAPALVVRGWAASEAACAALGSSPE